MTTLLKNLKALSGNPEVNLDFWYTTSQLVDICTNNQDHFYGAVKEARPIIDTLNKTFRLFGLPTIDTNRKNRSVEKAISDFAENCGIVFTTATA